MRKIVEVYERLPLSIQLIFSALGVAVPFYFAAYLSFSVSEVGKQNDMRALSQHAIGFIVALAIVFLASRLFAAIREELKKEREERLASLLHTYAQIDRIVTYNLGELEQGLSEGRFIEAFVASVRNLQEIIAATYSTFEAAYGKSSVLEDRIDFEVTFMTLSYLDSEITIPAWANREGRAPRSLILRKNNPKIYANSVTAAIYQEPRPTIHIVEDTRNPEAGYHELYPGQTERIRSTLIFPVLSNKNELLGTLVVHCDKTGFFKPKDKKYWTDLLEISAKRLALTKRKMDLIVAYQKPSSGILQVIVPKFGI